MFARSKSSTSTSLEITSSDPNENISNNRLPDSESDDPLNQIGDEKRKSIDEQNNSLNSPISHNNPNSSKSILTKETLEAIHATEQIDKNPAIEKTITNEKSFPIESSRNANLDPNPNKNDKNPEEKEEEEEKEDGKKENEELKLTPEPIICIETDAQTKGDKTSTENLSTFTKQNRTMNNKIGGAVSNIGDSIMSDMKSIAAFGEEKLNDLAKEAEMAVNEVAELPKNVIDYVKTSTADYKKDDEPKANNNEETKNSLKDLPKKLTEPDLSNDNSMVMPETIVTLNQLKMDQENEIDKVKQNNKLNRGIAEDNTSNTSIDNNEMNTDVEFIDNGVDISNTTNIIQAMKDEMNEISNDVQNKADELTMKYDGIINDELNSSKEMVSNKLFQVKNGWLRNKREFPHIESSPLLMLSFLYLV